MVKPEEGIVGCQVFYAYSTQLVWPYLLQRLLRKAQSIGNAVMACGSSREGRHGRDLPGTIYSCQVAGSPGVCSLPALEGEGRTYTCKHGLLLSWSCRAIHHQFAELVTFVSVAECGAHTVLSLLCVKCTLDFTDTLYRNYRWCHTDSTHSVC